MRLIFQYFASTVFLFLNLRFFLRGKPIILCSILFFCLFKHDHGTQTHVGLIFLNLTLAIKDKRLLGLKWQSPSKLLFLSTAESTTGPENVVSTGRATTAGETTLPELTTEEVTTAETKRPTTEEKTTVTTEELVTEGKTTAQPTTKKQITSTTAELTTEMSTAEAEISSAGQTTTKGQPSTAAATTEKQAASTAQSTNKGLTTGTLQYQGEIDMNCIKVQILHVSKGILFQL